MPNDRSAKTSRAELVAALRRLEDRLRAQEEEQATFAQELEAQQAALVESQRLLEGSRDRYADLYDFAPICHVSFTAHGVIEDINLTGARLLEIERARLIGIPFLVYVENEDRRRFLDHMRRCRQATGALIVSDLTLKTATGRRVPAELQSRSLDPKVDRSYRTAVLDLTERRRLAAERAQLEAERQRVREEERVTLAAGEAKDRFLAMLSHELRTPLTSIRFALASLAMAELPASLAHVVHMVRRNVELEARLIDDLLDVTRIQREKLHLEPALQDLQNIVAEVAEMLSEEAQARKVEITVAPSTHECWVRADPTRIRQVVWNLVSNALKHTPAGGRVGLSAGAGESGMVRLVVDDTGSGIARDLLPRIFEPFAQGAEEGERAPGLGLGLAICRGIVEAHGGRIAADSAGEGQGSRFTVELKSAPKPVRRPARQPLRMQAASRRSRRILLVEDSDDNAAAVSAFLRARGYQVEVARSVADAVAQAGNGFDVLVSDLGLPDGSGHDLMRRLGTVPGIAMSGYGTREDIERSRAAGFQRHLTKPVDPEQLVEAIEALVA
jgi:PAS domain S-box-containing protein